MKAYVKKNEFKLQVISTRSDILVLLYISSFLVYCCQGYLCLLLNLESCLFDLGRHVVLPR